VKIGPVVLVENRLTNGNCTATQLQFDDRRLFVTLAFENELEYWYSDFSIFICHQLSTLCEILMRFSLVTPEFKCMLYNGLEWDKRVLTSLDHDRQLYNTFIQPSHESPAVGLRISRLSGSVG